ncbi:MAG: class I SAM-dependent methyltransferase [Propioniciclava sp.]|nr:class I SAM-dependent methyltransferase [Propioniciclava sp.]
MLPAGARDVLDLGAGTGRLTDSLVARGLSVVAVDPSTSMLAVLAERHPGVRCLVGTGESIPLPGASVDAIVVGQAWHWMDPDATSAEAARVLRPGGTLAMAWNMPDLEAAWRQEVEVIQRGSVGVAELRVDEDPVARPPFGPLEEFTTTWSRWVPAEDFIAGYRTHSTFLVADPDEQESRVRRWREVLARVGDPVLDAHTTTAWRFRLG